MKISILYEDKNVLVINKPAGVSVHGDGRKLKEKTVADWILKEYPKLKKVGEPEVYNGVTVERPGIVHRLDKDTSGVLVIAKDQKTFLFLKEQFQKHKIEKIYRAFVYGSVKDPQASLATGGKGVIKAPIGRSPNDIRMWTAGRGAREPLREAVTEYKVISRFQKRNGDRFSYLEIYPKTGRTHQIRVHLRYINAPIVSDPLYYSKKEKDLDFKRTALHAYSISFTLPDGNKKVIIAPLPADFQNVIKKYLN